MGTTFWISSKDMDLEQKQAVEKVGQDISFLLKGPAGSGKSNILLLRAKWFTLKNCDNYKIILFTSSLKDFFVEGSIQYGLNPENVITQISFFKSILREYNVNFEFQDDFETNRKLLADKVLELITKNQISDEYLWAILVDEAQDYTATEIEIFRRLTKRLILAADTRQNIYKNTLNVNELEKYVEKTIELKYHYRSGIQLCKVADAILDKATYEKMEMDSQYAEDRMPSSVTKNELPNFEGQMNQIIDNISSQLILYPEEKIGVLFPKREQVELFNDCIQHSKIKDKLEYIRVDTLHGGKGWEFRVVHIAGCEKLSRMGSIQKRLIYTGILRGKTSASIYYTGYMPGYLSNALSIIEPPASNPSIDELFF